MEKCPCGSELDYSNCCEPLIKGEKKADTAEALIRSRYSAYVKKEIDYIAETVHPDQRQEDSRKTIENWAENTQWHKLEILECSQGGPEDITGSVEFTADYTEKGKKRKHHELAVFKKFEDQWYFFDGKAPQIKQVIRSGPKTGRNEPCTCGSGKKYKKCCGR
ncbi:SEC-C motif-containing protein [Desulfonema limicola]|uniref:SEC-C motif-containing protein n=1 Tax=Desulfonema limicola TaxID=45656 RepID=A0A975GJU4_9BACT|nr:YchJ family protein [Desulfonema limicola]QTA83984.1 SEC-C motif-containing protein [Desulfonema limicola]